MHTREALISPHAFDAMVASFAGTDRAFELIGGEIKEMVSNSRSSAVAAKIIFILYGYILSKNLGFVTGADGGYKIGDDRYIPDAAFISRARQSEISTEAYNPIAPDLAVEVLSPSNADTTIRQKIGNYLAAGSVLWLVDPETRTVEVYAPGQPVRVYGDKDMLDGSPLFPDFSAPVKDFFPA